MAKSKKANSPGTVLEILRKVLPKAVNDSKLIEQIYSACEKEIQATNRVQAFEKFCSAAALPDLKAISVLDLKRQFEDGFGKDAVKIIPDEEKKVARVQVTVGEETFESVIKVGAVPVESGEEGEFKPKFIPFPVALATDPELVWMMARGENLTSEESAVLLQKTQDDFWASKAGQKALRDRVERTFAEFLTRVPAKMLTEVGLKRHYKEPEAIKILKIVKT
ncbi:MAG: hypothetical protein SFY81_14425 [Verrucomicrobiota bacterium]|nr:hypothetical protein [Verrucomicrobiota bacterium]